MCGGNKLTIEARWLQRRASTLAAHNSVFSVPLCFLFVRFTVLALLTVTCAGCGRKNSPPRPNLTRNSTSNTSELTTMQELAQIPYNASIQSELSHAGSGSGDWKSEALSAHLATQLKELSDWMLEKPARRASVFRTPVANNDFTCPRLRPVTLREAFRDDWFWVRRYEKAVGPPLEVAHIGSNGIHQAISGFHSDLGSDVELDDVHFKVVRIDQIQDIVTALVFVDVSAHSQDSVIQQTAKWQCQWKRRDTPPSFHSIEIVEFEEVRSPRRLFSDATATVLGGNQSYSEHIIFGYDHWRETLDWRFGMEVAGPYGLAVGDVNGDELDDVFFCESGGLPNRLFVQQVDGTVEDISASSGLDFLEPTHSALMIDVDNDGDQDMILASSRFILLMENDGSGRFDRRQIHSTMSVARSLSAADFDSDGDLDLYVCGYFPREATADGVGLGRPIPYHDANNGVRNHLFSNQGDWQFVDVTESTGLDTNNRRFSYASAWEDYDNDGDPDLYVANDFGRNNLYRNDQGRFVDVAAEAGVEDMSAGMSVSWGDYDRDGWMDIYVGNMFSSAGNRITYQRRFKPNESNETRAGFQRHARGNSLFRNRGDGTFEDVSVEAGVTMGRWSWSCNFVDINNDGWDDLLVGNGMVTSKDDPDDL